MSLFSEPPTNSVNKEPITEHHIIDATSPQWQRRDLTVSFFLNAVPLQILLQNSFAFSSLLLMYFSENLPPVFPKAPGLAQGHT